MECPDSLAIPGKSNKSKFLLRVSRLAPLAGILACPVLGCTQSQKIVNQNAVPANAKIVKAEDLPKITPKPETSVAFGQLRLHAAMDGSAQGESREEALAQARKMFEQAIKTDPKCTDAYKGLAQVELTRGNYDGGLDYYRKALTIDPKASTVWYELGVCQARHGNWPASVESLQQASNLDRENRVYVKTLGFCLAKNSHYDDSVACFMRIMDEGQARYNLARMLHYEKQDDLSRAHLIMAIQANPKLTAAQDLLAQLDGRSGPTNSAVAASSGPSVAIDIDDVANEISETPGNAN